MSTSVKYRHLKTPIVKNPTFTYWCGFSLLSIFLFILPYYKGVFNGGTVTFQKPLYAFFLICSGILLTVAISSFRNKLNNSLSLFALCIWGFPLLYTLSMLNSASAYQSAIMVIVHISYTALFLLGIYMTREEKESKPLEFLILSSGFMIAIFGFMNIFGNVHYADAIYQQRLTSVFQYPNTYAALLMGLLISSLYRTSNNQTANRSFIATSLFVIPIAVSFFLTYSRGALLTLLIVVLLVLFLMKSSRQISFLLNFAVAIVISLEISDLLHGMYFLDESAPSKSSIIGWMILIGASLFYYGLVFILNKYFEPWLQKRIGTFEKHRFIVPLCALLIGTILLFSLTYLNFSFLPDSIAKKIENINFKQSSVLERGTFYKDSIKILKDNPMIGAGGGAWSALFEKYQSNPYVSRQAHNYFLQNMVETGILGLSFSIILFVLLFSLFIRFAVRNGINSITFFIIPFSILAHSMLDFNMSFIFIGGLVFLCLGAMIGQVSMKSISMPNIYTQFKKKIYPTLLCILSISLLVISMLLLRAHNQYTTAVALLQASKPVDQVFQSLDKAINTFPKNPEYSLLKSNLLLQLFTQTNQEKFADDAARIINQLKRVEPYNRFNIEEEYNLYMKRKQYSQALELIKGAMNTHPWEISFYDRNIALNLTLGNEIYTSNPSDPSQNKYWNQAIETYMEVIRREEIIRMLPAEQVKGNPFTLSDNTYLSLGQIYYLSGKYQETHDLLYPLRSRVLDNMNEELNRKIARWYIAAITKLGRHDTVLLDKLTSIDSNENKNIDDLINIRK
ncbi:O-antigen ligase family protein [Paenibacillus sp. HJGM_3]|uniref:O-antigen ligase family protein n=1 Tax=Paenibacillus sp. HJGM_3 TaxID=3379816 RepID=UPI00385A836F